LKIGDIGGMRYMNFDIGSMLTELFHILTLKSENLVCGLTTSFGDTEIIEKHLNYSYFSYK